MQETQEMWVQSLGQEDPLEEEMTTHSSILAWKIPWTEEPGGYSPWGWRVRHNWVRMYSTTHSDLKQHFTVLETRSPKIKELAMWQSFWMLKQRIHSLAFPDSIDHIHSLAVATSSIFKAKSTESTNLSLSLSDLFASIIIFSLTFQHSSYKDPCDYTGPTWISSVAQSCLNLCHPMDCSMLGFPVHHPIPEFTQTRVHWVSDAIQPSHPLSSPSPPALNHSQHQGLFKWGSPLCQVAKALEFQLQHQSFQ